MPKPTKGPRLGGGPAHERLLLANLAAALFTHKSIQTTINFYCSLETTQASEIFTDIVRQRLDFKRSAA